VQLGSTFSKASPKLVRDLRCPPKLSMQALEFESCSVTTIPSVPDELRSLQRIVAVNRRWATALLLSSSITGTLTFILSLVGVSGITTSTNLNVCFHGQLCPSGRDYQPDTLSEAVSHGKDPAGKLFNSFALISAILMLISKYSWELRNVFTGGSSYRTVASLRSVVPFVGIIMVLGIRVTPSFERVELQDRIAVMFHIIGALMFVVGYTCLEIIAIVRLWAKLHPVERKLRLATMICSCISCMLFGCAGCLLSNTSVLGMCCKDVYVDAVQAYTNISGSKTVKWLQVDVIRRTYGRMVLMDTASGTVLGAKQVSFWFEWLACVCINANGYVIWYFSEERNVEVPLI